MGDKYLITGATGFIGSHLVELLLSKNISAGNIRLLVLPDDSLKNLPNQKFDIFYGDIRNKKNVKQAVRGIDIVYHLAAKTVFDGKTYDDFKDTNVDGTKNIVDACVAEKVSKFIFFSSIAVYGLPAFVGEINNWDENQPKAPAEAYGKSKLEAEKIVERAHIKNKLPSVIIRPTTVYGPRDHQGVVELYRVVEKKIFALIGSGKNRVDYVYVTDLVNGAYLAQNKAKNGSDYILGGGAPITFEYLAWCVAKSLKKKYVVFHIPKQLAILGSYLVVGISWILGIRPPLFPQRVKVMTTTCFFNVSKASKELGYNPKINFYRGAILTASWYKNLSQ